MGLLTDSGGGDGGQVDKAAGSGADAGGGGAVQQTPGDGGAGTVPATNQGATNNEPGASTVGDPASTLNFPEFPQFVQSLDEDIRNDPSMKVPQNYAELAKMFVHGQRAVGAEKIVIPGKHADQKVWNEIYQKLGMPEAQDKYEVKLPEGMQTEEGFLEKFKEHAFKNNIMPAQASSLLEFYESTTKSVQERIADEAKAAVDEGLSKLKEEWGPEFEKKINTGKVALEHFNDKDKTFSKYVDEVGLDSDPEFLKFMSRVGESLNEDTFNAVDMESIGLGNQEAKQQIEKIQGDKAHPFNDPAHPGHNRAVQEMFKLHEKAAKVAPDQKTA